MKHLVVIGDIVASRELPARAQFQHRLELVLKALNARRKTLASPYTLTLGDEFQAVYAETGTVFADVFAVLAEIAPVRARFALAVGDIVTPINPKRAIGMDGPAFHHARHLLEELKSKRRLFGVKGVVGAWSLPSATLAVLSGQVKGWRTNRLKLFSGMLAGKLSTELARSTEITARAVNKNVQVADLAEWQQILNEISRLLEAEAGSC